MSSTSFQASADSPSDLKELECEPLHSAKSNHTAEPCLESTGLMSRNTTTLEHSPQKDSRQMELDQTLFAEASPVRTLAWPERALESRANDLDSGRNTPVLLANYDRNTSLWKTSQLCLEGDYQSYAETWPKSGMTRNGTLFQLQTLAHRTAEKESGLFPTPCKTDGTAGAIPKQYYFLASGKPRGITNNGVSGSIGLARWVNIWPTPAGPNDTGGAVGLGGGSGNRKKLYKMLGYEEGKKMMCGTLNANWVEWLMGFPITWSVLARSETPSSRKSPKSSEEQSCKRKE